MPAFSARAKVRQGAGDKPTSFGAAEKRLSVIAGTSRKPPRL
jgi:hypothetical protein